MALIRVFLSFVLAIALAIAPVAATAAETGDHGQITQSKSSVSSQDNDASNQLAQEPCHQTKSGDKSQDDGDNSNGEHCGACCLAHHGIAVTAPIVDLAMPAQWHVLLSPDLGQSAVLPIHIYGLKRPPRI